jgi:hypothetical protein
VVDSFTKSSIPPFLRRRLKDRSKIDLNAFDLWGIAAIGDIFSWGGGLSLISLTFLVLSAAKCASASVDQDDW